MGKQSRLITGDNRELPLSGEEEKVQHDIGQLAKGQEHSAPPGGLIGTIHLSTTKTGPQEYTASNLAGTFDLTAATTGPAEHSGENLIATLDLSFSLART